MHVDSYLAKGTTHNLCEDYVLTGLEPYPHVIVCDGCSSSPNTDVGARILAHSAQCVLSECMQSEHLDVAVFERMAISRACVVADSMGLDRLALDCTLLVAVSLSPTLVSAAILGDGTVFFKEDGEVHAISLSYSHNAPKYPSYLLDAARAEQYKQLSEKAYQTRRRYIDGTLKHENSYPIKDSLNYFWFDTTKTEYVGVCTDGAESLCAKDGTVVDLADAMTEFTNYKLTRGPFIKRRMKTAMKKYAKQGIQNTDDIGIACLMIGD